MVDVKVGYYIGTCIYSLLLLNVVVLSKASPSPDDSVNSEKFQNNSESKISAGVSGSKNAAAIAQQNCEKYAEYRYVKKWNPDMADRKGFWYNTTDCVNVETLITKGTNAKPKEYPHMALIGYGKNFENVTWPCGGSLISEKFILTAAQCGGSNTPIGPPKWVLLGDLDTSSTNDDAKPAVYGVAKIYDHPNFKRTSVYNDIALIELNTTVVMSPYVRPACLYTSTNIPTNTKASVTGWGKTGRVEPKSNHLLKATIPILDDEPCKRHYNNFSKIFQNGVDTSTMICAADLVEGKDTCQGDSGGPLQIPLNEQVCMWSILGITSFGPGVCGNLRNPSIYTKVPSYLDWIQNIIWP